MLSFNLHILNWKLHGWDTSLCLIEFIQPEVFKERFPNREILTAEAFPKGSNKSLVLKLLETSHDKILAHII